MSEHIYLQKCLKKIKNKVQWGEFNEWTSYNFDLLSDHIFEETKIRINSRTLRRIIENKTVIKPQAATKIALVKYLGYKDWEDFKKRYSQNGNNGEHHEADLYTTQNSKFGFIRSPWTYLIVGLPLTILLTVFAYPNIQLWINKKMVEFKSTELTGVAPHTVNFYYDVKRLKSSNIFIDQNFYDDGKLVPIEKYRHYYKAQFDLPDYYAVKIVAGGEKIKCVGIHVTTDGWEYIAGEHYHQGSHNLLMNNSMLSLPVEDYTSMLENEIGNDYLVYRNIRNFNAITDDIVFETRFRNLGYPDNENYTCKESKIELINKHGRVSVNFVEPGCEKGLISVEFGENILNGEFDDLNTFFQDTDYWRNLKIIIQNKRISVVLDNNEIYSIRYKNVFNQLLGLSYEFKGLGQVDQIKISRGNEVVYNENFDQTVVGAFK
ncbi:MAG: hypothetical protein ACLFQS_06905 [Bacteroidales bacterium]